MKESKSKTKYKKDGSLAKIKNVEPIRDRLKVEEFGQALLKKNKKYFVMWRIGLTTGLRISDILQLKVSDVRKNHIVIQEEKTDKVRVFSLNYKTKALCEEFIEEIGLKEDDYIIYSNKKSKDGKQKSISRQQAYDILRYSGEAVGIENVGSHTCRKSFGYWHYKQFRDVATLQEIFNHSAPKITLRYIGITQEHIDRTVQELDI